MNDGFTLSLRVSTNKHVQTVSGRNVSFERRDCLAHCVHIDNIQITN